MGVPSGPIVRLAAAPADRLLGEVLPWLGALLLLVVVGFGALLLLRRALRSTDDDASEGFTLHDLRRMHAAGELTDQEFERARAAVIDHVKSATSENLDRPAPDPPAPRA